jgi:hypothetical protein
MLRKGLKKQLKDYKTVPTTNTGELVEYTKATEVTVLKELGKLTP